MNTVEIEISDVQVKESTGISLPTNFLQIGEIERDDIQIYMKQDIYRQIEQFSSSNVTKELGGILVGTEVQQLGKQYVLISGYIQAKYTDATAATLTFTHETWDDVHQEHKKLFPDMKIIGWHHTHPGYGVFLSEYDLFIQQNFFNLPFQLAYVVDPVAKTRGFFQWKKQKVEKVKGHYIYDDVGVKIDAKLANQLKEKSKGSHKLSIFLSIISVIMLVTTVLFAAQGFGWKSKFLEQLTKNNQLMATYNTLQSQVNQMKASLEQAKPIADNQSISKKPSEKSEDTITFKKYKVVKDDTLESICAKNHLDYLKNIEIIKSFNHIKDENLIYKDQTILLPINE